MTRQKCSAKARSGKRCGKYAIEGGAVCKQHGGAAPQVERCAKERMASLLDPAISELSKLLRAKRTPAVVRLGAIKQVLATNGLKGTEKLEVDGILGMGSIAEVLRARRARRRAQATE